MAVSPTRIRRRHAPGRLFLIIVVLVLAGIAAIVLIAGALDGSTDSESLGGSGVAATDARSVPAFDRVELAGGNDVTVHVGGPQTVVVRGDDNLLANVTTRVDAGRLVVGTKGSFATARPMSVTVTVPSLEALALSGSGSITVDGIDTTTLTLTLSGSGLVRATGSAERLEVTLSGSRDAELGRLEARDVTAVLSGSGRIVVTATETLDASVPGSGSVTYMGNPAHVTKSVTGSGAVVAG